MNTFSKEQLKLVYVIMEPGDAVFFHANLLHRSDQNKSDKEAGISRFEKDGTDAFLNPDDDYSAKNRKT